MLHPRHKIASGGESNMEANDLVTRLERQFTSPQARALAQEIETILRHQVKAQDFNELKEIVRDLAEAQKRTEAKVETLTGAVNSLTGTVNELAAAQKRTEEEINKLAVSHLRLERSVGDLQQEVGGIANTIGYMLENEACRNLPKLLADQYNIRLSSRIIRRQIGAEEVNFLAEGRRGRKLVLIVGEAKSKLAPKHLTQLKRKVREAATHHPAAKSREIVPVMVVHFARDRELQTASSQGVIVVQSFEW
jgi:chromosome segregation ATPase